MHFRFRFFFILSYFFIYCFSLWNQSLTETKTHKVRALMIYVCCSLSVCVFRKAMQPPVCSSTSHVLAPFRRWASANIDALHEADGKTKQKNKTKKLQTAVLHPPARASRDHWGAAASHSSSLCLLASLSLSAPPPQMHLGIQCRLIPLTSEDPCADTLRVRAVKIIIIIIKNWEKPSKKGK